LDKAPDAFRTISEVAAELDIPQHVLRFWETRFAQIKPMKRSGGRRYYRPDDVDLLKGIRRLLYGEGYTIRGVQRILREQGTKFVQMVWLEGAPQPPHGASDDEEFADDAMAPEAEPATESRGLRERISSLIGRDLGERDERAGRHEPPFTSAPEPRVEPTDRAIHGAIEPDPALEPEPSMVEPAAPHARDVAFNAPNALARDGSLTREDVRKLHAVLHELAECRKLIDAVVARAA
jgi:DNA-binding transcriptional MerR regulator